MHGCTISYNEQRGVYMNKAGRSVISDNVFINNSIVILGSELSHYIHDIKDNVVNNRPLYYIMGASGGTYTLPDAGQLIIVNSKDLYITDAYISGADIGVIVAYTKNLRIVNSTLKHNKEGVFLYECADIKIVDCEICFNRWIPGGWEMGAGIRCSQSYNVIVCNCVINHNTYVGIEEDKSHIRVLNCTIRCNGVGIYCWGGIEVHYSNIYGNLGHGLRNWNGSVSVNATYNWWGSPDGPEYTDKGDPNDPEEVYGAIYKPWLRSPWNGLTRIPSEEIKETIFLWPQFIPPPEEWSWAPDWLKKLIAEYWYPYILTSLVTTGGLAILITVVLLKRRGQFIKTLRT